MCQTGRGAQAWPRLLLPGQVPGGRCPFSAPMVLGLGAPWCCLPPSPISHDACRLRTQIEQTAIALHHGHRQCPTQRTLQITGKGVQCASSIPHPPELSLRPCDSTDNQLSGCCHDMFPDWHRQESHFTFPRYAHTYTYTHASPPPLHVIPSDSRASSSQLICFESITIVLPLATSYSSTD